MDSIILIVAMIAVFYFMIIRPENKRKKQAENMRNSLKKGERITTIGGMVGRIVQVNDATVVFETSEDRVRIEITKWGIQSTESMEAAAQKGGKKSKKNEETKEEIPAAFSFKASTLSFSLLSNRIVFAPAFDKSPAAPIPLFPVPITSTVLFCNSMFLTSFLYS